MARTACSAATSSASRPSRAVTTDAAAAGAAVVAPIIIRELAPAELARRRVFVGRPDGGRLGGLVPLHEFGIRWFDSAELGRGVASPSPEIGGGRVIPRHATRGEPVAPRHAVRFEEGGERGVVGRRVGPVEPLRPHETDARSQRAVHAGALDAERDVVRRAEPAVVSAPRAAVKACVRCRGGRLRCSISGHRLCTAAAGSNDALGLAHEPAMLLAATKRWQRAWLRVFFCTLRLPKSHKTRAREA